MSDWNLMFDAVTARLQSAENELFPMIGTAYPSGDEGHVRAQLLQCVTALDQLQAQLPQDTVRPQKLQGRVAH